MKNNYKPFKDTHASKNLRTILNDKVYVKKDMRLVCNCLEVNKFHGIKIPKSKYINDSYKECATLKNKKGLCIFCGYIAFYYNLDCVLNKEMYNKQYERLLSNAKILPKGVACGEI